MGAPLSACVANLVMEFVESELLKTLMFKCIFYKRFVDDCIACIPRENCNAFLNHFNSFHESLQFTMEIEIDKKINFLDLTLDHVKNEKVMTKWFQKPIHSGRYLNYFSDVPFHQKLNMVNNLVNRVVTLTDQCYLKECIVKTKSMLQENGYPENFIDKIVKKHQYKKRNQQNLNSTPKAKFVAQNILKIPYIPVLSESLKTALEPIGVQPVFTKNFSNKKLFTNLKSKVPTEKMSNVVYEIKCKDCEGTYIGQTKRYLQERIKSHKYDKKEPTALHHHMIECAHEFDFEHPKVLARENNRKARLTLEAIHIKRSQNAINFRNDTVGLSKRYDGFFL